jgi:hypothetical protein
MNRPDSFRWGALLPSGLFRGPAHSLKGFAAGASVDGEEAWEDLEYPGFT